MTLEEYYDILKAMWREVDQNDPDEIIAYNEFKNDLRKTIEWEEK